MGRALVYVQRAGLGMQAGCRLPAAQTSHLQALLRRMSKKGVGEMSKKGVGECPEISLP
jgi:hypothetical protein